MDAKGSFKFMTREQAEKLAKEQNAKVYEYKLPTGAERLKAIDPPEFPLDRQEDVYKKLYQTVKALEQRCAISDRDALRRALVAKHPEFAAMQKHRKKTFDILTSENASEDYLAFVMYGVQQMRQVRDGQTTMDEADQVMLRLYDYLHLRNNQQDKKAGVKDPRVNA
jgi:hypothetical protein